MIKIKDIMAIVAVAVMTGGCSSKDDVQQDGCVPIRLSATVESSKAGHTRAGTTGSTTQDTELLDGQTVAAYIKEKGGDWLANPLACTVSGTDGDLTYSGNYNYPMDGTPVTIYAVHPSSATSGDPFTVSSDQTDADNYAASDLCYSKTADYNRQETAQTLIFNHVLSKIIVNVDVSGLGITPAPAVTNLMLWAKTQTTMTYPTGSNPDYSLSDASTPGYIAMNVGGAAIIPPQTTTAAGDVRITFDVAGIGPIAYEFPASSSFESNKEYTFTVNVGSTITVTSSINPWGGSATTAAHSYTGSVTPQIDIKKNPLWYVAEYNLAGDNSFSKTMSTSQGHLFIWSDAKGRGYVHSTTEYDGWAVPTTPKTVVNETDGVTWHIPTHREFLSIIPFGGTGITGTGRGIFNNSDIQPGSIGVITEQGCTFGYNNDTKYYNKTDNTNTSGISYDSYWNSYVASSNVRYAIRFLGTPYCSVWRYRVVDYNTENARLEISARLINEVESSATVALGSLMTEIMNKDDSSSPSYDAHYWDENINNGAIQRVFYACGYNYNTGAAVTTRLDSGLNGFYWTTTIATTSTLYRLGWKGNGDWLLIGDNNGGHNFSVRLFRDN